MFGYVLANASSLSKEEKEIYKAHYCGLCRTLRENYGTKAVMALSYDMVFLEMLLSDISDADETKGMERCVPHPVKEHQWVTTKFSVYAADMQMLLGYYSLLDKVRDEGKGKSEEKKMRAVLPRLEEKYPRIAESVRKGLDFSDACSQRFSSAMTAPFSRMTSEASAAASDDSSI